MAWSSSARCLSSVVFCLFLGFPSSSLQAAERPLISSRQAESIYRRLIEEHWSPRTGLFRSFPNSLDAKLSQQASTYEQGAMGLLAIRFGDYDRAEKLLTFFKTAWDVGPQKDGPRHGLRGLSNFYNADFGSEGIEKTIHVGPNAWAGLFAARLANTQHNDEAFRWALDVAYWIANSVPHENGAVAMSVRDDPHGAPWTKVFSTENNLSYYAFLTELLRSSKLDANQRQLFKQERDRVENWLIHAAFDKTTYRISRGMTRGIRDPVAALDTATWFVSAIGPKRLAAIGIDPNRLMETAAKTFEVSVAGKKGVDATDQTEANLTYAQERSRRDVSARPDTDGHRVIWYEGLGQYILAWSALAEYHVHSEKSDLAAKAMAKAKAMVDAYDAASLSYAPKGSAYPYATAGGFFRDGWHTPLEGENGPASSLIAGVWRCFAGLGVDPVSGREIGVAQPVQVQAPKTVQLAKRKAAVFYGTSEDMVTEAWRALNDQNWDAAILQSQATIQEWAGQARKLQAQKMRDVGQPISYGGDASERDQIFKYWALNDVGAAYFILGKAYDEKRQYDQAALAFREIVDHYSLAQIWDPQGWFWAPADAVQNDYIAKDPLHYGAIEPQFYVEGSKTGKSPNQN